jgi:hypothetical protein
MFRPSLDYRTRLCLKEKSNPSLCSHHVPGSPSSRCSLFCLPWLSSSLTSLQDQRKLDRIITLQTMLYHFRWFNWILSVNCFHFSIFVGSVITVFLLLLNMSIQTIQNHHKISLFPSSIVILHFSSLGFYWYFSITYIVAQMAAWK